MSACLHVATAEQQALSCQVAHLAAAQLQPCLKCVSSYGCR